jgi:hypothetical protein
MDSRKQKLNKKRGNRNAIKHGAFAQAYLLPDENIDELTELRRKLRKDLSPEGEVEHVYFELIVTWAWRLLRAGRWIKTNRTGEDYEMLTEIEVPARIASEYDRAVRRLFQFRAMRNMFNFKERASEDAHRENALAVLPQPDMRPDNDG